MGYSTPGLSIRRFRSAGAAKCEQCGTVREWTRERARQHAAQHGHVVRYVIEDTTIYGQSADGEQP